MAHNKNAEAALLAWVNTFPLEPKVESLADLSDGYALSKILEDFDSAYAINDLERNNSPSKWLSKKKCLEAVYKSLLRYTSNNCESLDSFTLEANIDLNAIAENDDAQQMLKLLTVFLMAAVNGPNNEKYVKTITTTLDRQTTQPEIAKIIQQQSQQSTASPTVSPPQTSAKDNDLVLEEKHATLLTEHKKMKARLEILLTQHEYLSLRHDELKEVHYKTDRQLKSLQDSNDGDRDGYIKSLQTQIEENNNLIASQEQQLEADRVSKDKLQKELGSLRPNAQRLLELEDEVKVLKTENASLTKKANMVDHFQRKLEMQSGIERENTNLRERIDILQDNQKDYDKVYEENERLKVTFEEYRTKFLQYESEYLELSSLKNSYKDELRERDLRIESLNARQVSDEKFIDDLQEQIRTGNQTLLSPTSPAGGAGGLTLEEELQQSGDPIPNYLLEISRLKAENQLLKSSSGGTSNATLRTDLEEAERVRKRLEENLKDLLEKHAISQKQLEAVLTTSSNEKDGAIAHTRKLNLETNQALTATQAKLTEVQSELSNRDRELLAAKADLAAMNQDEIDALEDLKATNEIITSSLQNDLLLVQSKHKNLITDYDQQRAHLVEALLAKDKLREEIDVINKGRAIAAPAPILEDNLRTNEVQAAETKAQTTIQALNEQTQRQEVIIQDLQHRLKNVEEGGPDAQKAKNEALIKNLTRENAMISTAWYDLTTRLQSNHLVLQRRQDMPKTWLGKQRQMVNATTRR